MYNKKFEIIIDNNFDHEGKYQIEIIKSNSSGKFIKNYKLNNNNLNYLINYLNLKNIIYRYKNDNINQNDNSNTFINSKHPEYANNKIFSLDSYRHTINAKYGDSINKQVSKYSDNLVASNEDIDYNSNNSNQILPFDNVNNKYDPYISQTNRTPK